MPSIYPNLKNSDRKYIRTEKARIRRQFLDMVKQEEMITELYKRMVGKAIVVPKVKTPEAPLAVKAEKAEKPKKAPAKKPAAKKAAPKK